MPINSETLNRKLFKVLARYKPKPLDTSGDVTPVEDEADVFKFTFTKDGKEYGDVFATIDNNHALTLYFGDDVANSPSDPTPGLDYNDSWSGFLQFLKNWAMRNQLSWHPNNNKDHLASDMSRRKNTASRVTEGYYPMGKSASYCDAVPKVKIILQHTRKIEEGEQRFRNIAKIFVETADGERFLVPTKLPGIARVYARHIAEGGTPYDDRSKHITSLVEEYQKMAGFVRATKNGQFNESALALVSKGHEHYNTLRETLHKLAGRRGYDAYFESWKPSLTEEDIDSSEVNSLFVRETLDPRIESVIPILSRIQQKEHPMKEINQLEEWAAKFTQIVRESHMSDVDVIYQEIGSGVVDIYDIMEKPSTEDEAYVARDLHSRYDQIAADNGLDEEEDAQEIIDLMRRQIAQEHPALGENLIATDVQAVAESK